MPLISFTDEKEIEWNDLSVSVSGAKVGKITGLTMELETEKEPLFAGGSDAFSLQSGNKKISGTLKVKKSAADQLWAAAVAAGGDDITDIEFDIVGAFRPTGTRMPRTIQSIGCQITKISYSIMQNDKSMDVELPFLALRLLVK